eukprot:12401710-Ditylum_brightwellii.AAC.2
MGDSLFASVPTVKNINSKVGRFKCIVKTAHALYPKDELEDMMAPFPGGTHLVMESTLDYDNTLNAIGYKYTSKKVICFIASKGTCSTKPGK